jgi:MSHA pilin protein MshD
MSASLRRRARGMTLIELILAIVVIGVGLAGVLVAFNQAVVRSADPMVRKQMLAIAEEMMEEITLKPYGDPGAAPAGCARAAFDDIGDFNGYAANGICDIDGNAIPSLATYDVAVAVSINALPNGVDARRIEVRVTHGGETLTLVGYRTGWAS